LYKSTDVSEPSAASIVIVEMHSSILFYSNSGDHMFVWNVCTGVHGAHSRGCSNLCSRRHEKLKSRGKDRW